MGLLDWFFDKVDPILDKVDPMHNRVQTWTTGEKTTEGQSPYFQTIAPMIVDAFLPGVGSAIGAADGVSTGNWGKAGLSALGSYAQLGGVGSTAAESANGGLAASSGTQGLSSTSGLPAGYTTGDAGAGLLAKGAGMGEFSGLATGNASAAGGMESLGAAGNGLSATSSNAFGGASFGGAYGAPASAATYYGYGGKLNNTALASADQLAASQAATSTPAWQKAAMKGGEMYMKNAQEQQQARAQMAAMQEYQSRMAANQNLGAMEPVGKPVASMAQTSPYGQFDGGFNPKRYGRNVRQPYGLMG